MSNSSASSSCNWKVYGSRRHPLTSLEGFEGSNKNIKAKTLGIFRSKGKCFSHAIAKTERTVINWFPCYLQKEMYNNVLTP